MREDSGRQRYVGIAVKFKETKNNELKNENAVLLNFSNMRNVCIVRLSSSPRDLPEARSTAAASVRRLHPHGCQVDGADHGV